MAKALFTPEELEELRRADAEIEAEFRMTREERDAGNRRDRRSKMQTAVGREDKKREYYEANREAILTQRREYYEANREAILAQQREYREANREAISAKRRGYYEENREAILAQQREYREANREAISAKQRELLKNFRLGAGMSQREFGRLIGVSKQSISVWETGAEPINLDILGRALPKLAEEVRKNE